MKNIKGLTVLARRDALTAEKWYELLEARRQLINPHLRDMTLRELGSMKIVASNLAHPRSLQEDQDEVLFQVEGDFKLDTRGIFPSDRRDKKIGTTVSEPIIPNPNIRVSRFATLKHKFWGYTRNENWITVEVHDYAFPEGGFGNSRHAKKVITREVTLPDLCAFCERTPKQIWKRFGEAIGEFRQQRQILWEAARKLDDVVEAENTLLYVIESAPERELMKQVAAIIED